MFVTLFVENGSSEIKVVLRKSECRDPDDAERAVGAD